MKEKSAGDFGRTRILEHCDIEAEQKPYHPSQLPRFKKRIGNRRLQRIMNKLLKELLWGGVISGEMVDSDATFIKAYSRRDPHDNSRVGV